MKIRRFVKKYFGSLLFLRFISKIIRHPVLLNEFIILKSQAKKQGYNLEIKDIMLVANEKTSITHFDTHYIYHPAWAARKIKEINPAKHVDISSTLHFSTQLSAFVPTDFYDYRPAFLNLSNLDSGKTDLNNLHFENNSIKSLSCMHTVEHIGLGRYGDAIDFDGDKKAIKELQRVLAHGGDLLFVVPVGKPAIKFNALRIYSFEQIINLFDELTLEEFSLIPDDAIKNGIIINADPELVKSQAYACGCFWFKKSEKL